MIRFEIYDDMYVLCRICFWEWECFIIQSWQVFWKKELSWLKKWAMDCCQELWIAKQFLRKRKESFQEIFRRIFTETTKDQPRLALISTSVVVGENLTVTKIQCGQQVSFLSSTKFEFQKFQITLISSLKALPYLKSYIYWKFTMVLISPYTRGSAHQVITWTVL